MLTVAIRGPLAAKMRELAETTGMSLAKLFGDMVLVYGGEMHDGYEPGTLLADWGAQQRKQEADIQISPVPLLHPGAAQTASSPPPATEARRS